MMGGNISIFKSMIQMLCRKGIAGLFVLFFFDLNDETRTVSIVIHPDESQGLNETFIGQQRFK